MDIIACEECDGWFHFECLGLTSKDIKKIEEEAPYICKAGIENQLYQLPENLNINTDEFETKATSPLTSPRIVIVTETDMIETVAIQDEMAQQISLLDHSEEPVQHGKGGNYQNAHGSSTTLQMSAISDDEQAETSFSESFRPFHAEPHTFYIYRQYINIVFVLQRNLQNNAI